MVLNYILVGCPCLINVWTTMEIKNGYILLWATPWRHRSGSRENGGKSLICILTLTYERWRMPNAFVHGGRKRTISTPNFSQPSHTTWVKILRIVREHKVETVNIFSNKSNWQFFSYCKKRQNSTFLAFAKILSIGFFSPLSLIKQLFLSTE